MDAPLTLVVYPGADGAYSPYEDGGKTFDYRKGEFMRIEMAWRDTERRLTLSLARGSRMLVPLKRHIEVRVAGENATKRVRFEGKEIQVRF